MAFRKHAASTIHSLLLQQSNSELEDHPLSADPNSLRKISSFATLRTRHGVLTRNTINTDVQTATQKRKLYTRRRHQTSFAGQQANYQHFNASIQRLLSFPEHSDCHRMCRRTEALCDKAAALRNGVAEHAMCIGRQRRVVTPSRDEKAVCNFVIIIGLLLPFTAGKYPLT